MTRPTIDREIPTTALDKDTMDRLIKQAEDKLEPGIFFLYEEYEKGLVSFRGLDDLVDDEPEVDEEPENADWHGSEE